MVKLSTLSLADNCMYLNSSGAKNPVHGQALMPACWLNNRKLFGFLNLQQLNLLPKPFMSTRPRMQRGAAKLFGFLNLQQLYLLPKPFMRRSPSVKRMPNSMQIKRG